MGMGLNLSKVLELTLNEGRCLVTGEQVWDDVPPSFDGFEALLAAYRSRVRQVVEAAAEIIRADEAAEPGIYPRPWMTVLSRGGIDAGLDVSAGHPKYNPVGVTLDGIADAVNSLCAVERLVFQEGRLTLAELREVLRSNWAGREPLRQYVLNRLPRFGTDAARANELARDEAAHYAACFRGLRTHYGGRFWPMIFGVATGFIGGKNERIGATPGGRRTDEMLAFSLQPSLAGKQGCTTALLRSVAQIDHRDYPGGVSNVQEMDPSLVDGERGLDRLVGIIRAFFDMGGMELALNFVSEQALRNAQKHPDRHRQLMVRLFGLSAQFVNLSPQLQERVIERVAAAGRRG
jgi:formate C-acetyltransferase